MKAPTLEGLAKTVCSLLVSAKDGRDIKELESDYREILGKAPPYAEVVEMRLGGMLDLLRYLQSENRAYPAQRGRWKAGRVEGAEKIQRMVQLTKTSGKTGRMASQATMSAQSRRGRGAARTAGRGGRGGHVGSRPQPLGNWNAQASPSAYHPFYPPIFMPPFPIGGFLEPPMWDPNRMPMHPYSFGGPVPMVLPKTGLCSYCNSDYHQVGQCPSRPCENCGAKGDGHGRLACPRDCCFCQSVSHKGKECPNRCRRCPPSTKTHTTRNCLLGPHEPPPPSSSAPSSQSRSRSSSRGRSSSMTSQEETVVASSLSAPLLPPMPSIPSEESALDHPRLQHINHSSPPNTVAVLSAVPPSGPGSPRTQGRFCTSCRGYDAHTLLACRVCLICRGDHAASACPTRLETCWPSCRASAASPGHLPGCLKHLCSLCGSNAHTEGACHNRWCLLCDEVPARHNLLDCPAHCVFCGQEGHVGRVCPNADCGKPGAHNTDCLSSRTWHTLPDILFLDPAERGTTLCPSCGSADHDAASCPLDQLCLHCNKSGDGHEAEDCLVSCCHCGVTGHIGKVCPQEASKNRPVSSASTSASTLKEPASPAKAANVCTSCGNTGHAGGPNCPNLVCEFCGAKGSGHGALGCSAGCCFCLSRAHKGRHCPQPSPDCRSSCAPNHTNACVRDHMHGDAFRYTFKRPVCGAPPVQAHQEAPRPSSGMKGRGRGRGLDRSAKTAMPGGFSSPPGAQPLPGFHQEPPISEIRRETVESAVRKVVRDAGPGGLRFKDLDSAYATLTNRRLGSDMIAVGGNIPSLLTNKGPLKNQKAVDGTFFLTVREETDPSLLEEPSTSYLEPAVELARPSFEEVKAILNISLYELEEQGRQLPVNRLSFGLNRRSDPAWENEMLLELDRECADPCRVALFKFVPQAPDDKGRQRPPLLALKSLGDELLPQLERLLLTHQPHQAVVSGAELREWWLMDAVPEAEKEVIFIHNLQDANWRLRLEMEWFETLDGPDYRVHLGLGGTFELPIQPLPDTKDNSVAVLGSCVHHAGVFYVRLEETEHALKELQKRLNEYMKESLEWEPLLLESFAVDQLVAVRCGRMGGTDRRSMEDAIWWRGRLTRRPREPDGLFVDLFDKGTIVKVDPRNNIRRLPWCFMDLPTQAIRCEWADLVPYAASNSHGQWGEDASQALRDEILPHPGVVLRGEPRNFKLNLVQARVASSSSATILVDDMARTEAGAGTRFVAQTLKDSGFALSRADKRDKDAEKAAPSREPGDGRVAAEVGDPRPAATSFVRPPPQGLFHITHAVQGSDGSASTKLRELADEDWAEIADEIESSGDEEESPQDPSVSVCSSNSSTALHAQLSQQLKMERRVSKQ